MTISALSHKPVSALTPEEAQAELARLAAEIAHHDRLYYQLAAPEISDAEYDALVRRNAEIEARFPELIRPDSPHVGLARRQSGVRQFGRVPMLSLNNAFSEAEIGEFVAACRFLGMKSDITGFTAEPKIDGLSISIRYERGRLVRQHTGRRDRRRGRDRQRSNDSRHSAHDRRERLPETIDVRGRSICRMQIFKGSTGAGAVRRYSPIHATRRRDHFASST